VTALHNLISAKFGDENQKRPSHSDVMKNTKIVAWLLNRPIESSKNERNAFF
jgi:hypothetical protein